VAEQQSSTNTHDEHDNEVWLRCFTAAITGVFPGRESQSRSDPAVVVKWCGVIADAALNEERRRRVSAKSPYERPDVLET
jgi:hypothetical protein